MVSKHITLIESGDRIGTVFQENKTTEVAAQLSSLVFFFFQAEDGIRDYKVTGVQTCALPILPDSPYWRSARSAAPGFAAAWRTPRPGAQALKCRRRGGAADSRYARARRPAQIGRASCRERV